MRTAIPAGRFPATARRSRNRGGAVGAWLADLLLYLFGLSAWWWVDRRRRAGRRRLSPHRAAGRSRRDHPLLARRARLRARARRERRARGAAVLEARRARCRWRRAARSATSLGQVLTRGARLQRRDAAAARAVRRRLLAVLRHFVAQADGAHRRRRSKALVALVRAQARGARRPRASASRRRSSASTSSSTRARTTSSASRSSSCRRRRRAPKSERVVKEKQRPLFTDMPDSPLPPLALLEDAPPAQETVSAETLEFTSRLIERKLADFGVAAKVLAAYPGPGDHALRDRARGRREGRADRQPDQGPRARAVGRVDPRRRDDPGQVVHGRSSCPTREAADGAAGRDPRVDDLPRHAGHAHAGARQGHRRQAGGRRPRAHAAPAGRRHHRLGQVGRGQRDDPVAALQGRAAARCG